MGEYESRNIFYFHYILDATKSNPEIDKTESSLCNKSKGSNSRTETIWKPI